MMQEIIDAYWNFSEQNYTKINDVLGALACSKIELKRRFGWIADIDLLDLVADWFYTRFAIPYEDRKIQENGDLDEFQARIKADQLDSQTPA